METKNKSQLIRELSDKGYSVTEIAKELSAIGVTYQYAYIVLKAAGKLDQSRTANARTTNTPTHRKAAAVAMAASPVQTHKLTDTEQQHLQELDKKPTYGRFTGIEEATKTNKHLTTEPTTPPGFERRGPGGIYPAALWYGIPTEKQGPDGGLLFKEEYDGVWEMPSKEELWKRNRRVQKKRYHQGLQQMRMVSKAARYLPYTKMSKLPLGWYWVPDEYTDRIVARHQSKLTKSQRLYLISRGVRPAEDKE